MRGETGTGVEPAGSPGSHLRRREILVPGGYGTAFAAWAGQLVEIVDLEGQQVADFVAFAERNRTEWLSTTHIRSALLRLTVHVGDRLESNWRRPMFEIIRDDVGRNDIITSMCDDRRYRLDYGVDGATASIMASMATAAAGRTSPRRSSHGVSPNGRSRTRSTSSRTLPSMRTGRSATRSRRAGPATRWCCGP